MAGLDTIFYIVILIFSVILHEVAHGYVADMAGDPTARLAGRLTLNPVSHIDLFGSVILPAILIFTGSGIVVGWAKPVPYNPYNLRNQRWGTLAVAIAGVATNFLIALIFGLLIRFAPGLPISFLAIAKMIVMLNIVLGVFNLLPIPPLDGSKVLLSLFPRWFYPIEQFAERNFMVVIMVLIILLPVFFGPVVGAITQVIFGLFTGVGL
ncbi:MAG: site-2 protease family protein [Candidatus Paceibacterota bacterium]|jgi:Zn-dependent protease